ncbi:MAG: hypothetical protein MI746_04755 [Pseudomonadales bacterium]|nr:hypothetical protein [Pseudomonadales bacterium]
MDLESRGIPSGFVASTEFIQAADAQAQSLGICPASVFVPHPIQDRSDAEMTDLAKEAVDAIIAMVVDKQNQA